MTAPAAPRSVTLRGLSGDAVTARVAELGHPRRTPALFLHGLVGRNRHWAGVVRSLRGRLRCVLLELPLLTLRGPDCSVEGVVHLVSRFLDLRPDAAGGIAIGSSLGGHVALRLLLESPRRFAGLVLAGSSGLGERPLRAPGFRLSRGWLAQRVGLLVHDPASLPPADLRRAHALLQGGADARAMVRLSRSACADDLAPRLPAIDLPTLVLWGRQDRIALPTAAEEFARLLPRATLRWLDSCGHAPMLERPAEFAAALASFTGTLSPDAPGLGATSSGRPRPRSRRGTGGPRSARRRAPAPPAARPRPAPGST